MMHPLDHQSDPSPPFGASIYLKAVLFGTAYIALALFGTLFSVTSVSFTNFWLPGGLFVAVLLLNEQRHWPQLVLVAVIANLGFDLFAGKTVPIGLLFSLANCLEATLGAWLVLSLVGRKPTLTTVREVVILVVCAAGLSPAVGAGIGAAVITGLLGGESYWQAYITWWGGDALGVLLLAPLIITGLAKEKRRFSWMLSASLGRAMVYLSLLLLVTFMVFNHTLIQAFPLKYILIPILLLIAMRFEMLGVSIANLLLALLASGLAALDYHDIAVVQLLPINRVISLQLFLSVTSVVGLLAAVLIAERKRAEEDLRAERLRLIEIIRGTNVGTWEWNVSTGETTFNERWAEIIGYTLKDLAPVSIETWLSFSHPEDLTETNALLEKHFSGELEFYERECRMKHKDGRWVWVLDRGRVSSWTANGKPLLMSGTHTDINERKRNEEQRLNIEKLSSIGTLAGGLAHDFNNILAGLYGNLSLAKSKFGKDQPDHPGFRFLAAAEKSLTRATLLTNQLLTFAKGGAPIIEVLNLGDLVVEVVNFNLAGSNVKPVLILAENLWLAKVDQGQIQQVFGNLTLNAKQSMADGGHLYISMSNAVVAQGAQPGLAAGRYLMITVADAGCGIAGEHLPRIFEPYFSTKQTGSGLGLATIYSIINKHGGNISVTSELGKGTIFTLYLPAAEVSQRAVLPTEDGPMLAGHSENILLMDDEEMIRSTASAMLEHLGFTVATAIDGQQALELYQQAQSVGERFDLVILDLTIPGGIGGKETAKKLLRLDPAVNMIVSSGYADDPVMAKHLDYGFQDVIAKPYTLATLSTVLSRVFAK